MRCGHDQTPLVDGNAGQLLFLSVHVIYHFPKHAFREPCVENLDIFMHPPAAVHVIRVGFLLRKLS